VINPTQTEPMSIDKHKDLKDRTKAFALRVIKMSDALRLSKKPTKPFWLEMLADSGIVSQQKTGIMLDEANQLMLIFSASRRTAKA